MWHDEITLLQMGLLRIFAWMYIYLLLKCCVDSTWLKCVWKNFCINNECQTTHMCDDDGNEDVRKCFIIYGMVGDSSFIFNEFIGYAHHKTQTHVHVWWLLLIKG